jgi:hypothetical protein
MNASEADVLIDTWVKYHEILEKAGDLAGQTSIADDHLWAIERMDDIVNDDPDGAWGLIMELLLRAQSDYQLACLASGLLENFLVKHGSGFIDRIERAATQSDRFRETLTGVWKNEIPDDVWARVKKIRQK